MDRTQEIPLKQLIAEFRLSNESRNLSPKTVRWYEDLLAAFRAWLESEGPPVLGDLTLGRAQTYVRYLQERPNRHTGRPLSTHAVHAHVRVLKVFASYLADEEYTEDNVLRRLRYPKTDPVSITGLSDEEILRIKRATDGNGSTGFRNWVIVCTFLDTGLRLAELADLTTDGLHLEEGYLDVIGKGRKRWLVPVAPKLRNLLLRYWDRYRPVTAGQTAEPFFLSEDGTALSRNAIALLIKRLGESAGVPRVHPHRLRHSFATGFLREGGDIETLRRILGHSDLRMSARYVHLLPEDLRLRHRLHSPMESFLTRHGAAPARGRGRTQRGSSGPAASSGGGFASGLGRGSGRTPRPHPR
jgi:site-specific recombinase XerD